MSQSHYFPPPTNASTYLSHSHNYSRLPSVKSACAVLHLNESPPLPPPPCIYYIIVVDLPTVNWLVDHHYSISSVFYQRDFSTAPSINFISTSFIHIIIYFFILLILFPNFSSLSTYLYACIYSHLQSSLFDSPYLSLHLYIIEPAGNSFIIKEI